MGKKKKVQKELKDSVQKVWLAGLGALAVAEEEGSKVFANLIEKGSEYESKGRDQLDRMRDQVDDARGKASSQWDKVEEMVNDAVVQALGKLGIPSRDEISDLNKKVEALQKSLDAMKKAETAAPAKKTTTKRTTKTSPAKTTAKTTKASDKPADKS